MFGSDNRHCLDTQSQPSVIIIISTTKCQSQHISFGYSPSCMFNVTQIREALLCKQLVIIRISLYINGIWSLITTGYSRQEHPKKWSVISLDALPGISNCDTWRHANICDSKRVISYVMTRRQLTSGFKTWQNICMYVYM